MTPEEYEHDDDCYPDDGPDLCRHCEDRIDDDTDFPYCSPKCKVAARLIRFYGHLPASERLGFLNAVHDAEDLME